jgi:hypothetical protein
MEKGHGDRDRDGDREGGGDMEGDGDMTWGWERDGD